MLHAIESGKGMSEMVRSWVESVCGKDDVKKVLVKPVEIPGGYGTCSKCGKAGVKTAKNRELNEVCYECAGVK